MFLTPKIDEVRGSIIRNEIDLALMTETWLKESVFETVVDIPEFTLLRSDRKSENHGGVCAYIKTSRYKYKLLNNLNCCHDHKCLWIHLRPNRLPREIPCIIIAVIYHPPGAAETFNARSPFSNTYTNRIRISKLWSYTNWRFKSSQRRCLLNHFCLKQIVKIPTRKEATLDLMIITNMYKYYNSRPQGFPAFGFSDHNTIVAFPKNLSQRINTKKVVTIRDKRTSRKAEMERYLAAIHWSSLFASLDTCEDMWNVFHAVVQSGLDILKPHSR